MQSRAYLFFEDFVILAVSVLFSAEEGAGGKL